MRAAAAGAAIVALVLLLAFLPTAGARPALNGVTPGPTVQLESYAVCATTTLCTVHPALSDPPHASYLVMVFVHGPGGKTGTIFDSQGDPFHNLSYCWLDNGIFGHTVVYLANATIANPLTYRVSLNPHYGQGEYMEVALAYAGAVKIHLDAWSNTCANHWTNSTQDVLPVHFAGGFLGDLGVYFYVLGQANLTQGTIHCYSDLATVATCGTSLSGNAFGLGLSWPSLAYANFDYAKGGNASIRASGSGYGTAPCPWDVSYLALTSL